MGPTRFRTVEVARVSRNPTNYTTERIFRDVRANNRPISPSAQFT